MHVTRNILLDLRNNTSEPFLCQKPATYNTVHGRRCDEHAEVLRQRLRNPNTLGNIVLGRARTEEEISKLIVKLPEVN